MHKIVCLLCGHERNVSDDAEMAPVDYICPMCNIRNDDRKIDDDFGKMLVDPKDKKKREEEFMAQFYQVAKERLEKENNERLQRSNGTKNMVEAWKYKVVFIEQPLCATIDQDASNIERILNQYGALGWELIHVENRSFYFKKLA